MGKAVEFIFNREDAGWRCDAYAEGFVIAIGRGGSRLAAATAARKEAQETRAVMAKYRREIS